MIIKLFVLNNQLINVKNKKNASIIIATYNRGDILEKTLNSMLNQDYLYNHEIIVINDGSTDNTKQILQKFSSYKKIKSHNLKKNSGPATARNIGIKMAKFPIIVIMDDDCIPEKDWLRKLVSKFSDNIGVTTSYSLGGGTSTAFLKKVIDEVGYFDENFPFAYREDSDLLFRALDGGYEIKGSNAKFRHLHKSPKTIKAKIKYALKRIFVHQSDVLLYKKHPEKTKVFLDIKLGFIRHPIRDFKIATGLWSRYKRKRKYSLSSPQEIVLLEPKSIFHKILIFLGGIIYAIAVKFVRFYGSIKYKKFLI